MNGFMIHSFSLAMHWSSAPQQLVFEIKGKGKKKKPKSKIFGKEK